MSARVRPPALLLKGILLCIVIEVGIMRVQPRIAAISVYAALPLRRERFPISTRSPLDAALDVGNLEAMFASHVVSVPKASDEYRVMVLGDSATWGTQLREEDTLPAQLGDMNLSCRGRKVKVYNLSFPRSSATKDLMILDQATAYEPDLIIWMLTWYTLMPKTRLDHFLITQNPDEFYKLAHRFDFLPREYVRPGALDEAAARNAALFRAARYQIYAAVQLATGTDQILGPPINVPSEPSSDASFEGLKPPTLRRAQVSLDQVQDAYALAGPTPLIVVNEPMLVLAGLPNSTIRYNNYYPRWVYDQYRGYLGEAARQYGWNYLDLWNSFPSQYFADTPLHLTPQGQALLAKMLIPTLMEYCQ